MALRFKTNEIICCLTSKKITRSLERKFDIALSKRFINSFFATFASDLSKFVLAALVSFRISEITTFAWLNCF